MACWEKKLSRGIAAPTIKTYQVPGIYLQLIHDDASRGSRHSWSPSEGIDHDHGPLPQEQNLTCSPLPHQPGVLFIRPRTQNSVEEVGTWWVETIVEPGATEHQPRKGGGWVPSRSRVRKLRFTRATSSCQGFTHNIEAWHHTYVVGQHARVPVRRRRRRIPAIGTCQKSRRCGSSSREPGSPTPGSPGRKKHTKTGTHRYICSTSSDPIDSAPSRTRVEYLVPP